jgi:hypothetical protein
MRPRAPGARVTREIGLSAGLAIVALACASSAARAADETSAPARAVSYYGDPGAPNISGLWLGTEIGEPGVGFAPGRGPADGRPPTYWAPWPLPYTAAYQKINDERVAAAKAGRQLGDTSASCFPFGMPRAISTKVYQDEITQTPGVVTIWVNSTFPIMIWTDGRPHPKDPPLSFNGHSIGYWAGDTLFVDTVGISPLSVIDQMRDPHSAKLHLKWTVQRVSDNTLHVRLTMYDDEAFKEPVTTTNIWRRMSGPEWAVLDDESCFENNKNLTDSTGAVGFPKF